MLKNKKEILKKIKEGEYKLPEQFKVEVSQSFAAETEGLPEGVAIFRYNTQDKAVRFNWESWSLFLMKFSAEPDSVILDRYNNNAPFQLDHRLGFDSNIGVILEADHETAKVKFDIGSEKGKEAYRKVKDGICCHVSMGTMILGRELVGKEEFGGEELEVFEVTKHEPYELSLVTVPALKNANVVNFNFLDYEKNGEGSCDDSESSLNLDIGDTEMLRGKKHKLQDKAGTEGESGSSTGTSTLTQVDVDKASAEAVKLEKERLSKIKGYAQELDFTDSEALEKFENDMNIKPEEAKLAMFEAIKKQEELSATIPDGAPAVNLHSGQQDKVKDVKLAIVELTASGSSTSNYANFGIVELANELLKAKGAGVQGNPYRSDVMEIIKLAHDTTDFPTLLVDSGNRVLEETLKAEVTSYQAVGKQQVSQDLRSVDFGSLDKLKLLESRNEGAQYARATFTEGKVSMKPVSKGLEVEVFEELLMNDDLGAFNDVVNELAETILATRNFDFYNVLANHTFENSASYSPTSSGISDMITAFRKIGMTKNGDKRRLNQRLAQIVCPPDQEGALLAVLFEKINPDSVGNVNVAQLLSKGKIQLISEVELTDYSTTNFYGFGPMTGTRPATRYIVKAGAENGRIRSYFRDSNNAYVFQAQDYFQAKVTNSAFNGIKSTFAG